MNPLIMIESGSKGTHLCSAASLRDGNNIGDYKNKADLNLLAQKNKLNSSIIQIILNTRSVSPSKLLNIMLLL